MAKWALVIAGLKDLQRPADKLSLNQNLALAATGFIWVSFERGGGAVLYLARLDLDLQLWTGAACPPLHTSYRSVS